MLTSLRQGDSLLSAEARDTLFLDPDRLAWVRDAVARRDPAVVPAWEQLSAAATEALAAQPGSVTTKAILPPSGDPHDYTSLGVYWWPDPDAPGGAPYVKRDGRINPEVERYDQPIRDRAFAHIRALILARFLTGETRYAEGAGAVLRTWFLDPDTAMNPNMDYAQFVPGRASGRCYGIIEMSGDLPLVLDLLNLLPDAPGWGETEREALRRWMDRFYAWLLESPLGQQEGRQHNNHGVFYDRLVAALALWLGREAEARERLERVPERRCAGQIEPDGRMPLELRRTRSWHYSVMNLAGFFGLARLGERIGLDLWHAREGGGGLEDAARFLFEHARGSDPWPYPELDAPDYGLLVPLLEEAQRVFGDPFSPDAIRHRLTPDEARGLHRLTGRHPHYG